jgi:hypothetical protein
MNDAKEGDAMKTTKPKTTPKKKKLDAEALLRLLEQIRTSIPDKYRDPNRPARPSSGDGRMTALDFQPQTAEDFDLVAAYEGIEATLEEVSASVEYARAKGVQEALKIYYAAEELARDPEHADLIPHVEKMREAYERDFGKPIPPKPKE